MNVTRKAWLVSLALLLMGCGAQQSLDDATAKIAEFHAKLDSEHYGDIWQITSEDFRKTTDRTAADQLFSAIHRKLGKSGKTEQTGWRVNSTTGGTYVELAMATTFERGKAQENFVFLRSGDDLKLAGYNVNSPALIVN